MKKYIFMAALASASMAMAQDVVVATDAYRWAGDSIIQGEYTAYAVSPYEIQSNYHARPHYYMPVEKEWKLKNDISTYPQLSTGNKLLQAVYNMGLDEMINAVEPDTTLRTGKEWAGVWTRDVSYSIILSMAYLQPEASMISLMKKVNDEGQIIQDTGSGGAWPISTDRMVWALAAYEIYKVTGDKKWLETVYPIVERSVAKDKVSIMSSRGLAKGETSFIDWREQSYPKWMHVTDIAESEAMNTNMVYAASLQILSDMASDLGKKEEAKKYAAEAAEMRDRINEYFWLDDKGYYGMYFYGREFPVMNPRAETLGESLAILYDIATLERQKSITENNPITPYGSAIFFPQIADMPNYHNNALWPFVGSYWALANAKAGNEEGTLEAIGAIIRPAALFATNKENFNLDNGDIFTELNSSNMLWSLSGNLALVNRILFGVHFEKDGLRLEPFVPKALADVRKLENFPYRGKTINITVEGYGSGVKEMTFNGKKVDGTFLSAKQLAKGGDIKIVMNSEFTPMKVNHSANVKAPLTPIAWLANDPALDGPGVPVNNRLSWNPVEYIDYYIVYRDGQPVAKTKDITFEATVPGEYMVVGVNGEGVQSFASQPFTNRPVSVVQLKNEKKMMGSSEIAYPAAGGTPSGYHGEGFVEIDHSSPALEIPVGTLQPGEYIAYIRYANGNGPYNTENKAAIRSLMLKDKKLGTVVMPHRASGRWDEWGLSNGVRFTLPEGVDVLTLEFRPEDENMNLSTNHALIDEVLFVDMNSK